MIYKGQSDCYIISYHYEDCENRKPMSRVSGQGMWQRGYSYLVESRLMMSLRRKC